MMKSSFISDTCDCHNTVVACSGFQKEDALSSTTAELSKEKRALVDEIMQKEHIVLRLLT